jgi:hypothetical protein
LSAGALASASALSFESGISSVVAQPAVTDATAGMFSLSDFEAGARENVAHALRICRERRS